jgi:glycine dehydrogenase subunit 2
MPENSNIHLIFEKGVENCCNNFVPAMDVDAPPLDAILPPNFQRKDLPLPDVPEVDIIRHYINLSRNNYGVDNGIYPLGSCTMKYNPKINELVARLAGFANAHPLQTENLGAMEVLRGLGKSLCEITGMDAFTMEPAAGAHGELCGLLVMKRYFEAKKLTKTKIIVPDSAHGTNPASASMAGFAIIELTSNSSGEIPLDQLEFALKGGDVAGLMLTNPNTLGLFDRQIKEITRLVHQYGGLCYYDGANMNPMLGVVRPGDMGFDIIHLNLHKSFSTPHGGGGPGAGPVGVKASLMVHLPNSCFVTKDDGIVCTDAREKSIGRLRSFWGNFGILLRAYTYILALGGEGLRKAGQISVLNANYLRVLLRDKYHIPYDRICQHEFVIQGDGHLPNNLTAEDVAKRILDYGFYAPTIYFPLIVHGAMMIEPTETQSKASLDEYAATLLKIYEEAEKTPEILKDAPHITPVGRLDATLAARKPILRD